MNNRQRRSVLLAVSIGVTVTFCRPSLPLPLTSGRSAALPPGAAHMLRLCSRPTPHFDESWKLDDSDVQQLERDLPHLRRLKARGCCLRGARVDNVDAYLRQYIGLTIKGRRYVYINAFPASAFERWPSTIPLPDWRRDSSEPLFRLAAARAARCLPPMNCSAASGDLQAA